MYVSFIIPLQNFMHASKFCVLIVNSLKEIEFEHFTFQELLFFVKITCIIEKKTSSNHM